MSTAEPYYARHPLITEQTSLNEPGLVTYVASILPRDFHDALKLLAAPKAKPRHITPKEWLIFRHHGLVRPYRRRGSMTGLYEATLFGQYVAAALGADHVG